MEVDRVLDYDVLVAAESREVFEEASKVVSSIARLRPLYSGPLRTSRTLEQLTPTLLNVGQAQQVEVSLGQVRLTELPGASGVGLPSPE